MKLGHVAIWTEQLEGLKEFYVTYFGGVAGEKFTDSVGSFASYFITFHGGAALELMQKTGVSPKAYPAMTPVNGLTHITFEAASPQEVDAITARLQDDGFRFEKPVQMTSDGFYESAVFDPENNIVEMTCHVKK